MRAYGVRRGDRGCCPGHDKHPHPKDGRIRGKTARSRPAKKRARQALRAFEEN